MKKKPLALLAVVALTVGLLLPAGAATAATAGQALTFHEITPCAVFDTRPSQGGTGIMAGGETRTFHVVGATSNFAGQGGSAMGCGIPGFSGGPRTQMVYLNLVAVDPTGGGNLKAWATGDPEPAGGVVNYQKLTPNFNNSNAIVVGVRQDSEGNDLTLKANVSATHVRGVALGYLSTATSATGWSLTGNAGTDPSTNFVGTTDNAALSLRVNGQRALRLEPGSTPNLIGGHSSNSATAGVGATIGGGGASANLNLVSDDFGTIGGGLGNFAGDNAGTNADRRFATVGGGRHNNASGEDATISGGGSNVASAPVATVGGGGFNQATGQNATVGGGFDNRAGGFVSTVAGGNQNSASATEATVGGGLLNTATHSHATVGGGQNNTATQPSATVGGGHSNRASGFNATVGGGGGNIASGTGATVPGGSSNTAGNFTSFAAGRRAKADHDGSFVWGDSTDADVASSAVNQFTARTSGGARFFSNSTLTTGVTLAPGGGSWASVSDRAVKADLRAVEPGDVLAQVVSLPITTWRYREQDASIRHIGPMAQDFYATFGVGEDERHITAVDADGVALAAIQGLDLRDEAMLSRVEELEHRLSTASGDAQRFPQAAVWGLAAAVGVLGLGLGRHWGRAAGVAAK